MLRRVLVAGLLALGVVAPATAAPGPRPTPTPKPTSRAVETSRGRFDMAVYAPAGDPQAAPLVVLISGEGGWGWFCDQIAAVMAAEGYWVGGLDAKKYFNEAQDDRKLLSEDVRKFGERLALAAARPADAPVILAGYSFGADLLPRVAADAGWGERVRGLLLIGPDEIGSLQYHLLEMIGFTFRQHTFPVADALQEAAGIPMLFVHGQDDGYSAAPALLEKAAEPKKLLVIPAAGHHFVGQEEALRNVLRDGLTWIRQQQVHWRGAPGGAR